jgi:hypothetical protein
LGCILPEVRQENGLSVVAGAPGSIPMKRVSAPERTRERLRAIIDGQLGTAPERSSLVLLAAQLILEEALEGEVRDEIGRERYARAAGETSGYRNGYRTGRMKTAEGMVEFAAPQVRDTTKPFVSGIRQNLSGRTEAFVRRRWRILPSSSMRAGSQPGTLRRPSPMKRAAAF